MISTSILTRCIKLHDYSIYPVIHLKILMKIALPQSTNPMSLLQLEIGQKKSPLANDNFIFIYACLSDQHTGKNWHRNTFLGLSHSLQSDFKLCFVHCSRSEVWLSDFLCVNFDFNSYTKKKFRCSIKLAGKQTMQNHLSHTCNKI